ncbi:hypothetical protein Pmar_PMAR013974 [Perkinsus marinus ATCC 50983]|uniref:EamA domain-containing protein n=1 Tax=Perkinsus marinus (strain ATCC 50983 / TXsc) TaxID=423536 RepID=C5LGF3_PERM5|nr:hypothetical protein Pmar_PMAR013974 [Perkinsus marinus ATCC 50983]EER04200.1 hypothetical protein Pmar_PMAR013974 [Perkinsus marinus ATCC 50983]|eukprot:XP_002772384.1 hypothetical protein Pmar_PMAR013974 [Perkinsus marinus ATCC 50983]
MLVLGFMWLLQMWALYHSLQGISVAVYIIICQTTPLVVYFIDIFINGIGPGYVSKFVCILLAVLGIAIMSIEGMFLLLALRAVPALIFLICTILLGVYDHDLPAYTRADVTAMIWVTLADWAYNIAMSTGLVMLSPLWVTMGTVPSVPVALIFDMFAKGLTLSVGAWTGVLLTAVGFIVFNVISSREEGDKQREAVGLPSDQSD